MDGRRVTAVVLALVGTVVVAVLAWSGAFRSSDVGPEPGGPVAEVFPVPTWDWDGRSGMDALVSGRLAFTDTGCTLLVTGEGDTVRATAVFFPNAFGVRYEGGVRGVVDEVATRPPLDAAPSLPATALPTAPSTAAEFGWFAVPTFDWDPADGGDAALIEGTVAFLEECPVIEASGTVTGLILPRAEGFLQPDGALSVYAWFPDGSSGLMAMDGESISYGGGYGPGNDPRWTELCPAVDGVFWMHDRPFG